MTIKNIFYNVSWLARSFPVMFKMLNRIQPDELPTTSQNLKEKTDRLIDAIDSVSETARAEFFKPIHKAPNTLADLSDALKLCVEHFAQQKSRSAWPIAEAAMDFTTWYDSQKYGARLYQEHYFTYPPYKEYILSHIPIFSGDELENHLSLSS